MPDGYSNSELTDVVIAKTRLCDPASIYWVEPFVGALSGHDGHVLDFGGGAGLHYRVARYRLPHRRFRWAVVETPQMVSKARELETEGLKFFDTIDQAQAWLGRVDLVHSNSALQYVEDPEITLDQLVGLGAAGLFWDRMMFAPQRIVTTQAALLSEHGSGPMPAGFVDRVVEHRITKITGSAFDAAHRGYTLIYRGGAASRFSKTI